MNWLTKLTTGMLSAGILLSATLAPAFAAKFTFEQGGFFSKYVYVGPGVPDFPYTPVDGILTGQFAGDDIDGDQILTLNELTSFSFSLSLDDVGTGASLERLTDFSYNFNSASLQFDSYFGGSLSLDSSENLTSGYIKMGTASGIAFLSNAPVTIKEVSEPVTVPEPATLVGLGMLVLLSLSSKVRHKLI